MYPNVSGEGKFICLKMFGAIGLVQASNPSVAPFVQFSKTVLFQFIVLISLVVHEEAFAADDGSLEAGEGVPRICSGYDSQRGVWGMKAVKALLRSKDNQWFYCGPDQAYYGIRVPRPGRIASVLANCCPLPSADILTDEHIVSSKPCPPGYVVTGTLWQDAEANCGKYCLGKMRCTRINQGRYRLGPRKIGVAWGPDVTAAFPWKEVKQIRRDEIPPAIRFGISRLERDVFTYSGCVGDPFGSLFVGADDHACKNTYWQQLFKRESSGDTPITMFPRCLRVTGVLSQTPKCVK